MKQNMKLVPYNDPNQSLNSPPWQDMFKTASAHRPQPPPQPPVAATKDSHDMLKTPSEPPPEAAATKDSQVRLALYIATAHAGYVLTFFIFYGVYRLLEQYLRPILWAVLCSIPLRGIQQTLVSFWSEPLKMGLTETVLAIPVSVFRVFVGALVQFRDILVKVFWRKSGKLRALKRKRSGFSILLRWLVAFWVFVMLYENLGGFGVVSVLALGFMFTSSNVDITMSYVSSFRSISF